MKHFRHICALLSFLVLLTACSGDELSREDRVRQTIDAARIACESRNWSDLSAVIHESYADRRGMNKYQLGGLVQRYFFMHKNINLLTKVEKMVFHSENKVQVSLYVAMAGNLIADIEALSSLKASIYRFELQLVDDDGWKVTLASWQRSTLKDMMSTLSTTIEVL